MTENKNDLLSYIEASLENRYEKIAELRQTDISEVSAYLHKESGNKLILRKSGNRNDDVYRSLKGKRCEYLPAVYEVCSCDGFLIVLEEYIEGQTLSAFLEEQCVSRADALSFSKQICRALIFLHRNNVIHRDIKPSNIIIKPDGTVVLIDLGIARMITGMQEKDTQMLGTVGYAAPEQFGFSQSRKSTDIYALGVLLNIMLTGAYPSNEIAGGRAGKIIQKATSLQISKRYQCAEEMLKALKRLK